MSSQDFQDAEDKQQSVVSAYTQVKMEDAPVSTESPQIRVSRLQRYVYQNTMAKILVQDGLPCRSSWAKSVRSSFRDGHPLARILWEKQFEKVLLENGW